MPSGGGPSEDASGESKRTFISVHHIIEFMALARYSISFKFSPLSFGSVSTIYNLPVGPLVKASKEGWGRFFRHRYGPRYSAQTSTNKGSQQGFCTSCKQRRQIQRQLARSPLTATDENRRVPMYRRVSCFREQVERDDVEVLMDGERARRAMGITVIRRLTTRLQILWHEMKIPQPDRAYITSTYLLGWGEHANHRFAKTSRSYTQVRREVMRQISLLLRYRAATIKVTIHGVLHSGVPIYSMRRPHPSRRLFPT